MKHGTASDDESPIHAVISASSPEGDGPPQVLTGVLDKKALNEKVLSLSVNSLFHMPVAVQEVWTLQTWRFAHHDNIMASFVLVGLCILTNRHAVCQQTGSGIKKHAKVVENLEEVEFSNDAKERRH